MRIIPSFDYETYSEAGLAWDAAAGKWHGTEPGSKKTGLPLVGAYNYVSHPSFEVLCMAYDMRRGAGVQLWLPGDAPPADICAHVAAGGLVKAWNSSFEFYVWSLFCTPRLGWPTLRIEQMRCAMAQAAVNGYPRGLEDAGDVVLRHRTQPERPTHCAHGTPTHVDCPRCDAEDKPF